MRIAILVYGRLDKCEIHYNNIMETFGDANHIDFFASSDNSPYINDFTRIYKPVAYTNEKTNYQVDFASFPGKRPETNIHTMTCHFINKSRVFYLMEEHASRMNIQYDLIISLRVDLLFHTKFINIEMEPNTVYIPNGYDAYVNAINDQVAIGSFYAMKIYSNIYNNSIEVLKKGLSIPHPETLTSFNLLYNNIKVVRIPLAYSMDKW
jgi:hypothetical protein